MADIEGEWNGFEIRLATLEDRDVLQEHLKRNFYRDEPLCNAMGYSEELAEDLMKFWITFIPHNISLIAFDKNTNKVAGTRITIDHGKDFDWSKYDLTSWQAKVLVYVLGETEDRANIGEKYSLERYADWFLVSVDKEFRGRGLAQELYRRSINLAKAKGFGLVKCVFSSPYSRKAGYNLGFKELSTLDCAEPCNEKGERYFPNAAPGDKVTLGVLEL